MTQPNPPEDPIVDEAYFRSFFCPTALSGVSTEDIVADLLRTLEDELAALEDFLQQHRQRVLAGLAEPSADERTQGLENILHSIKGVSAVLGAPRLRTSAQAVLTTARAHRHHIPEQSLRRLLTLARRTIEAVRELTLGVGGVTQ